MLRGPSLLILLTLAVVACPTRTADACPYCPSLNYTITAQIEQDDAVAVIATMVKAPPPAVKGRDNLPEALFRVDRVLNGGKHLPRRGRRFQLLRMVYLGDHLAGTQFLVIGLDQPEMQWSHPYALTKRGVDYVSKLPTLPKKGAERLALFLPFLEDRCYLLARDAYDELNQAPYDDLRKLKPLMNHERLLRWITDDKMPRSRKRLYLMMLSVCGKPADIPMLRRMLTERPDVEPELQVSVEPIIFACVVLQGPAGMDLIDAEFMANKKASYTDIYSAIMALRMMGHEQHQFVSRQRVLKSLYHILDRPDYADLVVPDLARLGDWSAMDRLVVLFKNSKAGDKTDWVRVPVMRYLMVCPRSKARRYLAELKKTDPESYKDAKSIVPLVTKTPAPMQKPSKASLENTSL